MTQYTGVRYQAIDPQDFGTDSKGNASQVAKLLYSLTDEKGEINYTKIDKLASGRRITEPVSSDWFLQTFQCQSAPLGQQLTTTIGELAESLANEHFSQYPVVIQRVKDILVEKDTGLLQTWTLSQDIEVGFVVEGRTDTSKFVQDNTLFVAKAAGIIVSGRHRLSAILTLLEAGLKIPYSVYSKFKIRVTGKTFPNSERMAHYVRLANSTRRMSTPEKANIVQQVKYGVGSTSSIEKQLLIMLGDKVQDATRKAAFANIFRILTSGDTYQGQPITDITRYNVGLKLYTALFNYYKDANDDKHVGRINIKTADEGVLSTVLTIGVKNYTLGFKGLSNIARDGVDSAVEEAVTAICKTLNIKKNTALYDSGIAPTTVTVKNFEPLYSKEALDNETNTDYDNETPEESETQRVEAIVVSNSQPEATPVKKRAVLAKRKSL